MNNNLLHAIEPDRNAVVHAAAGTGKTWLLTSRIVRLLLNGAEPGSILAITFTRKAAQEMTERVHQRLLRMATASPPRLTGLINELGLTPTPTIVETARGLYERLLTTPQPLRTTTFHAFCQGLLRRFPLEAGVTPGFELIEETSALRHEAWRAFTREVTPGLSGPLAEEMDMLFAQCDGLESSRSALYGFLHHRSDWWAYTEDADDPVASAIERLTRALNPAPDDPRELLLRDEAFRRLCERYIDTVGSKPMASLLGRVQAARDVLAGESNADEIFAGLETAFFTQKAERRRIAKRAAAMTAGDGRTLAEINDRLCDAISAAREALTAREAHAANRAWYRCGARLLDHFQRLKTDRNQLDFADLEWQAYRLLTRSEHAEWVQYKLDRRIDHLLIDEFQDTNPTQWRLVLPLLQELAAGSPERRRSVFLVGDEKQSIYRFRRAEARLFRQAHDWLLEHTGAKAHTQDVSWRASRAIATFVNILFGDVCGQRPPAAGDEAGFALPDFRTHLVHHTGRPGAVHLQPLFYRAANNASASLSAALFRNPLLTARQNDEDRRHHEEGAWIAQRIHELIVSGVAIEVADDEAAMATRRLAYSDIFVLLRDRTHAQAYEDALRDAGIPFLGTSRRQFQDALEVRDLTNLLRVLISPQDDLAVAGVLRSPLFDLTDTDLAALAGDHEVPLWWDRLARHAALLPREHVTVRAWRLLSHWRSLADRVPVHDLLDRIYNEGNVVARYASAAPPQLRARVEANLMRLIGWALELDSGRYPSLPRFLAELTTERQEGEFSGAESATLLAGNCVHVLTIHGAKGLEAPVVFLADAARGGTERPRVPWTLIDWPVSAPRPMHLLLGGRQDRLDALTRRVHERERDAARREEANLLYVAVTRAKQLLYITGCAPSRNTNLGWYGFIERRLRRMSDVSSRDGVVFCLHAKTEEDATTQISGAIEYGELPRQSIAQSPELTPTTVDARLHEPFEVETHPPRHRPSEAAEDLQDAQSPVSWRTARMRGIVLHRALELVTTLSDTDQAWRRIEQAYVQIAPRRWLRQCWDDALAVVRDPQLMEFFDPAHYREARNELPLLYQQGTEQVFGFVDRLLIADELITLIDYKTNRFSSAAEMQTLAVRYAPQMELYARGIVSIWPQAQLRAVLIFTQTHQAVEVPLPDQRR